MPTERKIRSLKVRQRSIIASLNLIRVFVDGYDEETQADEVPVRLEHLSKLWSDYNEVQNELEMLDETALETLLDERSKLETAYYRIKGFLLAHNKHPLNECLSPINHAPPQVFPSASQVRLPDVKLPGFDDKLENWLNFHDLFLSLVHSSTTLSNIQKFYYLRSSLENEALQLIQSIPISAINYPVAWNLLLDHFQNTDRLKQTYMDALFEFTSLKRESATELHSLAEKFEANVRILKQLGEHTEHWDILLIRMLSTRLDRTTRRDWEDYAASQNVITFKDLTNFLQRRVTVLQSIQPSIIIDTQSINLLKKSVQRSVSSLGANQLYQRKCIICSDHHPLYLCEAFSKLTMEQKEDEVNRHQLCRNCLRQGHFARDCSSSSTCRKCRERHHTQLCSTDSFSALSKSQPTKLQQPNPTATSSTNNLPSTSASAINGIVSCASAGGLQKTILLASLLRASFCSQI